MITAPRMNSAVCQLSRFGLEQEAGEHRAGVAARADDARRLRPARGD